MGQTHQAGPQLNRRVLPVNPAFGEHHHLLSVGQQVDGQTQGGHRRPSLVHREAAEPLQKPALQPPHFGGGHHEAAVAATDPTASGHRQHQGIPAGAVRRCQQHRALMGEMLWVQHQTLTELKAQRQILGGEHRQGGPEAVDADTQAVFSGRQGRLQRADRIRCLRT